MTLTRRAHRLDLRLYRRATRAESPTTDRLLYPLSRAANHSKLWMGCAAGLALWGGRQGRRAALRGLGSVALTSAAINAVAKPLAGRARPADPPPEWLVRVATVPRSSSFPSGHAASAAAFAVGAGMEMPVVAAPLGLLAGAVAYSRVRTRVHYPFDVLAGAVGGATIALLTRRLWPVAPNHPAVTREVAVDPDAACPEGAGLAIVVNAAAGSDSGDGQAGPLAETLPHAELLDVESGDEGSGLSLPDALRKADSSARAIGIVGGDGSINSAAGVALASGKPLAVFPGGTLNHFARDAGLSVDGTVNAVQAGGLIGVDVGLIDGQPFLNTASFGSYAELVDARERLEDRIGKWAAMAVALVQITRRSQPVNVEIDGHPCSVWMIFIGNCVYEPAGLAPAWRDRLDDGLLDIRYVDGSRPLARTRLVAALLTGQLARTKVYVRKVAPRVVVRSHDGPLRLARDGETFDGGTTVEITKHADRLRVYAEQAAAGEMAAGRPSRSPAHNAPEMTHFCR